MQCPQQVQYVRDPLTSDNHFAIGFVGSSGVHANFVEADKSGIDSMKKLAALLDKAHREESDLQKLATGIGLEPQEYLATDGHKFYGLTVGRPRSVSPLNPFCDNLKKVLLTMPWEMHLLGYFNL
jgi:hypothetical protein